MSSSSNHSSTEDSNFEKMLLNGKKNQVKAPNEIVFEELYKSAEAKTFITQPYLRAVAAVFIVAMCLSTIFINPFNRPSLDGAYWGSSQIITQMSDIAVEIALLEDEVLEGEELIDHEIDDISEALDSFLF